MSRPWPRRACRAVLGLLASLVLAVPTASAATGSYGCSWPIIGEQPLTAEVTVDPPAGGSIAVPVSARLSSAGDTGLGLLVVGASSIEGTLTVKLRLESPSGTVVRTTAVLAIPETVYAEGDASAPLELAATGRTATITTPPGGVQSVIVESVAFSMLARSADGAAISALGTTTDSDGIADTFDLACAGAEVAATLGTPSTGVVPLPTPAPYAVPAPPTGTQWTTTDRCTWPLIGERPLTVSIGFDAPAEALGGVALRPTTRLRLTAPSSVWLGLRLANGTSLGGSATTTQRAVLSSGLTLHPRSRIDLPDTDLPVSDPGADGWGMSGSGPTQGLIISAGSAVDWFDDTLQLNLVLRDDLGRAVADLGSSTDSDRRPETFDVRCTRDAPVALGRTAFRETLGAAPLTTPPADPAPATTPGPVPTPEAAPTTPAEPRVTTTPAPTAAPTQAPGPAPGLLLPPVVLDGPVLRFRKFVVGLSAAGSCPRRATVIVRGSHGKTRATRVTRQVRLAGTRTGCVITSAIRLPRALAAAGTLRVRVTGVGLRATSRRVAAR